jgi:hypothetical protein
MKKQLRIPHCRFVTLISNNVWRRLCNTELLLMRVFQPPFTFTLLHPIFSSELYTQTLSNFRHTRKIVKIFVMSACRPSACNNSVPRERNFMTLGIWIFLSRIHKFDWNTRRKTDTLYEHWCTHTIIPRRILLGMRNVSEKICRENQNIFSIVFPKIVSFACRTTKATNTVRKCNTYGSSATTMDTLTRFVYTLNVNYLYCFILP